jgi:tRNA (guanine-N7-)-methyltransferase
VLDRPAYPPHPGVIRTFHPRRGRMSPTAAAALARLWATRGFDIEEGRPVPLPAEALFERRAPLVVEIGCGMGEALLAMAAADGDRDYLGVDVHTPGLGAILARAESTGVRNIAVARGDAVELFRHGIGTAALDGINVFFPDPWPKARHHKRRLIRPDVVALLSDRLRPGGILHIATDWLGYAEQMRDVLAAEPALRPADDASRPHRPLTKFERRGIAAGRSIYEFVFVRIGGSDSAVSPA